MGSAFSRTSVLPKPQTSKEKKTEAKTQQQKRKFSLRREPSSSTAKPVKSDLQRKKASVRNQLSNAGGKRDASVISVVTPCTRSFIEIKRVPKGNTKRDRRKVDDQENTKAEKPKKKPKTKRYTKRQQANEPDVTQEDSDGNNSAYMKMVPTEKTVRDNDSWSCPIMETACEEHAFITELANKPQPNLDNFFEMADPFANENDMLDISDTIFDVANEFPDIYLRGNLITPSESDFTKKLSLGRTASTTPTIAPTVTEQATVVTEQPTATSHLSKNQPATTQAARTKQG